MSRFEPDDELDADFLPLTPHQTRSILVVCVVGLVLVLAVFWVG